MHGSEFGYGPTSIAKVTILLRTIEAIGRRKGKNDRLELVNATPKSSNKRETLPTADQ